MSFKKSQNWRGLANLYVNWSKVDLDKNGLEDSSHQLRLKPQLVEQMVKLDAPSIDACAFMVQCNPFFYFKWKAIDGLKS